MWVSSFAGGLRRAAGASCGGGCHGCRYLGEGGYPVEHLLPGELGAAGSPVVVVVALGVGWGWSLPGTYVGAGCRGSWLLLVARWWWWPWGWVGVGLFQGHMLEHLLPGELGAAGSPVVVVALGVGWSRSLPGTYVGASVARGVGCCW